MSRAENEGKVASPSERLVYMYLETKWKDYTELEGVPTMKMYEWFNEWRVSEYEKKPHPTWNTRCSKFDFTRKVKKFRAVETTRRRINGEQVTIFTIEAPERYARTKTPTMTGQRKQMLKELEVIRYIRHCAEKKKRIIGVPTEKLWLDYTGWLCDSKYWKYEASHREFTMIVKAELKCETVRKMIHGKQVPVFWDSGATRLDLGNYLD